MIGSPPRSTLDMAAASIAAPIAVGAGGGSGGCGGRPSTIESEDEDEFFDCRENVDDETVSLAKWSSMEWTPEDAEDMDNATAAARVTQRRAVVESAPAQPPAAAAITVAGPASLNALTVTPFSIIQISVALN